MGKNIVYYVVSFSVCHYAGDSGLCNHFGIQWGTGSAVEPAVGPWQSGSFADFSGGKPWISLKVVSLS